MLGTSCVPGLSKHFHVLFHRVLGSGCFDYRHFTRDAWCTPGHAGKGCWVYSLNQPQVQQELDTQGSSGNFPGLPVTPNGLPFPHVSLWFLLLALIPTFGLSQACSSPLVSSIQLLTPSRMGPGSPPLLAALDGLGRHAWPQMSLSTAGGRVGGPGSSGCDLPGPSVKLMLLWMLWLSATPTSCIVDQQQPGSDAEAEFPFSWDLGMGMASTSK